MYPKVLPPSFRFEIGKPYPDGRRAVWKLAKVRPYAPDWVIVHVASDKMSAIEWIKAHSRG